MKKQIRIIAYLLSFIFLFLGFSETVNCYAATKIKEVKISSLEVFDGQEKQVQITGVFENNTVLDITDNTKLRVEDKSILNVKNNKILVGEKIGKTNLIVTYQGKETNLAIEVKADLKHFRKPVPKEKFSFKGIRNESSIELSWLKTQDMKSYKIYRSESDENSYKVIANNMTSFEYTDKNVDLNHVYYYKISGIHTNGMEEQLSKLKFELPKFQDVKPEQVIKNVVFKNDKNEADKTKLNLINKLINNDNYKKYLETLKKVNGNSYNEEEYTKLLQSLMKLNSEKDESSQSKNQGDIPKDQSDINKGQGDIPRDGVDLTKNQGDVLDKDNIFASIISITADEFKKSNEVVLKYRDKDLALKNEETLKLYRLDEDGNYIDPLEVQIDKVNKEIKFKVSNWGKYILDDKQVSKDNSKAKQNESMSNNSEEKLKNSVTEENKGVNNNSAEKKESTTNTADENLKEKETANSSTQEVETKEVEQKETTIKQEKEKIPTVDKKENNTTVKESEKINDNPVEVKDDKLIEDKSLNEKQVPDTSEKQAEVKVPPAKQDNKSTSTVQKTENKNIASEKKKVDSSSTKGKTNEVSKKAKSSSTKNSTKTSSEKVETKEAKQKQSPVDQGKQNDIKIETKENKNSTGNDVTSKSEVKESIQKEASVKQEDKSLTPNNYDDFGFLVTLASLLTESGYNVDYNDLSKVENNIPKENGIWIVPKDRELIKRLINKVSSKKYYVDSNGFLKEDLSVPVDKNKSSIYSDIIDKLIASGKKTIIGQNNQWLEYDSRIDKINPRFFSTDNDGVTIDYKGEKQIIIINKEGLNLEDNKDNSLDIVLAHEFIHTSFLQKNEMVEENTVVSFENRIRKELNYNIRQTSVDSTSTKDEYKYGDALYPGDTSDEVTQLQKDLIFIGFDLGGYGATGTYGEYTAAAIRAIQEYRRISITGNFGPASKAAVKSLVAQVYESKPADSKTLNPALFNTYYPKYKPVISYVKGSSGQPIVDLQKNLILLGMDLGGAGATGNFGDYTEAAVKAVQEYNGIEVIGSYGPKTDNAVITMLHRIYDKNRLINIYNKYVEQISLSRGSSGALVVKKQEKLLALGLDLGGNGATGYFGDYTEAAVKAVQEYNGIEVIGSYGPKTSSAIQNMLSNGYDKSKLLSLYDKYLDNISLTKGSSGALVVKKQEKLLALGLDLGGNGATGYFGDYTEAAVKAVQEYNGIEIIGAYGPKTATAIQKMLTNGYDKAKLLDLNNKYLDKISLAKGASGELVKRRQLKLLQLGLDLGGNGATGYFGDYTEAAVNAVQEYNGITPIGVYGPATAGFVANMLANGYDKGKLITLYDKYKRNFIANNTTINANASYGASIYYAQTDPRWANVLYSTHGDPNQTIGKSACGPAAMSMIISNMTDYNVTQYDMSMYALNNGDREYEGGTKSKLFFEAAAKYGLKCVSYAKGLLSQIKSILSKGTSMVIASMNPGHFTGGGHYIVLQGIRTINGENYFEVLDPNWPNPNYSKYSDGKIKVLSTGMVLASTSIFAQECGNGYWVFSGGNGGNGASSNTGSSSSQGSSTSTSVKSITGEIIVASGQEGDVDRFKYNFIETAIKKISELKISKVEQKITWLIDKASYSANAVINFLNTAKNLCVDLVFVKSKKEFVNYINTGSISGLGNRLHAITSFTLFGHGHEGELNFGYDYDIKIEDLTSLNRNAFNNTNTTFYSCNTGTNGNQSFAQAWANLTHGTVKAMVNKTNYEFIAYTADQIRILKERNIFEKVFDSIFGEDDDIEKARKDTGYIQGGSIEYPIEGKDAYWEMFKFV